MRRVISFLVASALLGCGFAALYFDLTSVVGFQGKIALIGGFLIAAGGSWLWADFSGPMATWFARKKYRRGVIECLKPIMMQYERRTWPGLDEAIDFAFKEKWDEDETAVLYAGNLLAREIQAMPDKERRHRIGENVRRWMSEPDKSVQFNTLLPDAALVHGDETQWHVQWALDFVRRLRETKRIDQGTQDWFNDKICGPLWQS